MKLAPPRAPVTFCDGPEDAAALLLWLHGQGLSAVADGEACPRLTVSGIGQVELNERVATFRRRCAETAAARERREAGR